MTPYSITTQNRTDGPWRESFGNKYAEVTFEDGRRFFLGVVKGKRVRIPYLRRGKNIGYKRIGFVRDGTTGKCIAEDEVPGSIGVRGLLEMAGLIPRRPLTESQQRQQDLRDTIDRWAAERRR